MCEIEDLNIVSGRGGGEGNQLLLIVRVELQMEDGAGRVQLIQGGDQIAPDIVGGQIAVFGADVQILAVGGEDHRVGQAHLSQPEPVLTLLGGAPTVDQADLSLPRQVDLAHSLLQPR